MKASAVYRKAAVRVARKNQPTCDAIIIVGVTNGSMEEAWACALSRRYWTLFKPDKASIYWGKQWKGSVHTCRVLALCLMAAIAEDEDERT